VRPPRLFAFERAWARAVYATLFAAPPALAADLACVPAFGGAAVDGAPGDAGEFLDVALARAPLEASIGIRLTLWMCALAPLFTVKRVCTITSLEGDDRARVLEAMGKSPVYAIRQLLLGLKAMLALHLAKDVRVRERLSRVAPEHEETLVSLRRTRAGLDRGRGKDLQGAVNDNAAE